MPKHTQITFIEIPCKRCGNYFKKVSRAKYCLDCRDEAQITYLSHKLDAGLRRLQIEANMSGKPRIFGNWSHSQEFLRSLVSYHLP